MELNIPARVKHKHDTEANWLLTNFIPMSGEIVIYDEDANHSNKRIKIGNGTSSVNDLAFVGTSTGVGGSSPDIDLSSYALKSDVSAVSNKLTEIESQVNSIEWLDIFNKPPIMQLEFNPGLKIAVIGASNSTKSGRDAVELTVEPEDVGVQLSAYATYYDIGTVIGNRTITESDVGNEVTFTPTSADVGKQIGKPKTYTGNASVKTWWMHLEEEFKCEVIPVCWSGSSISAHQENNNQYKCSHAFHESQIRKCGIRTPGTMERSAPDLILFCRAGNDVTHEPYCTITEGYFDAPNWTYPTTDLKSDETYGALESVALTIKKLREAYPMTPIVMGTMPFMKRVNYQTFPVNNGLYSWPYYNKKLREAADFFGMHTIDFDKVNITFENIYPNYAQDSAEKPVHQNNMGHALLAAQAKKDLISKVGDLFQFKLAESKTNESIYEILPYRVYSTTNILTNITPANANDEMSMVVDFQYAAPEQASCKQQSPMGGYGGFMTIVDAAKKVISLGGSTAGTYTLEEGHDYFIKTTMKDGTITSSLFDGADDTLYTPLDTITRTAGNVTRAIYIGNCFIATTSMYNQFRFSGLKSKQFSIYKQDELVFSGTPVQRITDGAFGVLDSVSGDFFEEETIAI